eukprot:2603951-Alexandrium_andersonii.AAC.1
MCRVISVARMKDVPGRFCEHACVITAGSRFANLRLRLLPHLRSRAGTTTCWPDPLAKAS